MALPACVGTWLSLVEHSLGVRGVGSSNLPVPTNNPSAGQTLSSTYELGGGVNCRRRAPQDQRRSVAEAQKRSLARGAAKRRSACFKSDRPDQYPSRNHLHDIMILWNFRPRAAQGLAPQRGRP